ncbi:MAG: alpha-2-macroglobulin [Desulfobulbus sp.]|nr:alpha-2-macroglobulin [Desulfobulbus sp.]
MKNNPFSTLLNFVFRGTAKVVHLLLGRLSWQPPPWLRWLIARPLIALVLLLLLGSSCIAGWYGWQWYSHLPKPHTVAYRIAPPQSTDYTKTPAEVYPLQIRFAESAAPLERIGKAVVNGLRLEPAQTGTWQWQDDRTLEFKPEGDWPIGRNFRLSFAEKGFFSSGVRLQNYQSTFASAPFSARIKSAELYQDPLDPTLKKLVAGIDFSHPVDPASLGSNIRLQLGKGLSYREPSQADFTLKVEKDGLHIHLHSAALAVPLESTPITLRLEKKIVSLREHMPLAQALTHTLQVPGRYQLSFSDIQTRYVNNPQGEPQQVLTLESSFPVADEVIAKHVQAWLLPPRKNGWSLSTVNQSDLTQSVPLTLVPSVEPLNTHHSFTLKVPIKRQLVVKVDEHVEAVGGYLMKEPLITLLSSGEYPKVVKLLGDGALLSLHGEKQVGFMAQGVPGVKVEIARLVPGQLHQLVDQNYGQFGQPSVYNDDFDRLVERQSYTREFGAVDPSKPIYDAIDLGSYLGNEGGRVGVFVLRITPFDPKYPQRSYSDYVQSPSSGDRRFILVTDLGIISKRTLDGGQEVFVQSLSRGQPVPQVTVAVVGRNGLTVAAGQTDTQGHIRFAQMNDLKREKTPIMVVASLGRDLSFLPLGRDEHQLDFSRFDIGGAANQTSPNQVSASLFTDRGLYRPGETAHIGFILRTAGWQQNIDGMPVEIEITDPRGMVAFNQRRTATASGLDALDFTTRDNAAAGSYSASIYLVKNNQRATFIDSVEFIVREFEPDRMKVDLRLSETDPIGWLLPDQVKPVVTARHLFGADASDRRVTAQMELSPSFPAFAKFPQYRFHLEGMLKDGVDEPLAETRTGTGGLAELQPNLQRFTAGAYRLRLTARVYEAKGGRNVAASEETLVASVPYLVGVRSADMLDYVTQGAKRSCTWLAVKPNLEPTAVDQLELSLIEFQSVSVLVKQESGTYKYESRRKEVVRNKQMVQIARAGTETPLPTNEAGDFAYELRDSKGTLLNKISWTVAGAGNLSRSLERNAELQIKLDKTSYAPGEPIHINLRAPYTGAGLITIERDKVYAQAWFTTDTTSSVQTIIVPQGLEGNGYVTVQFLRDPNSAEIFMSPLSSGVAPFSVSLAARTLPLTLQSPKTIEPGQDLQIDLSSKETAKAVVFAVDEGILQVARYKTPNPLAHFFEKRSLDVQTSQILSMILPEFSRLMAAAAPGGGGDDAIGSHLNPFKRKRQGPVAYWSGVVDLPAGGRSFHYQVPEGFNGRLRIMAVAVTAQRIGVATEVSEVRGPWVLTPNVPAFVAPGDRFTLSVGAFSNLNKTSTVQLSLRPGKGCRLQGDTNKSLEVEPGREGVAEFQLLATEQLGSSELVFMAESAEGKARIAESVSVRPATPYRVALRTGSFVEAGFSLPRQRDLVSEYGQVLLGYARSPLVWVQGLTTYLDHYPYECTEQLLSKAMPALVAAGPDVLKRADFAPISQAFSLLRQRQNESGGFGQWASNLVVQPDISVYAADFLIEAGEHGLAVPRDLQEHSLHFLQRIAVGRSEGLAELRTKARAIYLLTRTGQVTTAPLMATIEQLEKHHQDTWRTDLIAAYLGASQILMKQEKAGKELLSGVPWATLKSAPGPVDAGLYEDALSHDAELLTLLSRYSPEKPLPDNLLSEFGKQISEGRYHSLSAALMIRAFSDYGQSTAHQSNTLSAELGLDDNSGNRPAPLVLQPNTVVPLNWGKIILRQEKAGTPAFFQLTEAGFDRTPPSEKLSQGIELSREYVDDQGTALSQIQVGQEYTVRLRLRATERDSLSEIAIVDLLPGGLEPVVAPPTDEAEEYSEEQEPGEQTAASVSGWEPAFVNIRDDRVVLYGTLSRDVATYEYRVRATNAGTFIVPAPYAEGMYDRTLQGRGEGGILTILEP